MWRTIEDYFKRTQSELKDEKNSKKVFGGMIKKNEQLPKGKGKYIFLGKIEESITLVLREY